jgi:L-amino acid N-acyltransferase YncA
MHRRDATEADLPAIVEIYNATIPSRMVTADLVPVTVESRLPWFRSHDPKVHPLWVMEDQGQVCGWLTYSAFHSRPAYWPTAELSVYVAASARRRGIGRRLLADAIAHAPSIRLRTLIGIIWAHNEPSLKLFEAFGFERWGHLPRVALLDEVERDVVFLGRRVD